MRLGITLAAVVQAAAVSAADPVIVLDVAGLSYDDVAAVSRRLTPPDSMGCVGPNEFVEFINGAYAISTKQGVRQSLMSDTQFWLNAGIDSGVLAAGISDPRITFDPTVNRWFASEITVSASSSQVLVARSDTADPGGGWRGLHFTGSPGALADYDTLAVDATNVYLGTNNFVRTGGTWVFQDVTLNVIPKADLLAEPPSLAGLKQFADATLAIGSTPRGVTNYSTAPGHGVAFAVSGTSWQESERTTVLGSGTAATLAPTVAIPTQYDVADGPVPIVQSGGTALDVLDNRYSADVIQVGDVIYATNTVINGTRDAVHWIAVSESTNAVLGEGLIADPDYDFWQPSIGVNPSGTFLLAFNRASDTAPDGNVGIWGAVGTTTGTSLAVGAPFVLHSGTVADYVGPAFDTSDVKRWGDYSAVSIDPLDPDRFWTVQEIPSSAGVWGTRVIAVIVPEPSSVALCAGLVIGGCLVRSRRRASDSPVGSQARATRASHDGYPR